MPLEADAETAPCDAFEWQPNRHPPSLGAVVVVGSPLGRQPNQPLPCEAAALLQEQNVQSLPIPQRARHGCRDVDSQLARVIDIWPELSGSVQVAVLAMVEATRGNP